MKVGSLFAGIGGFDLGLERAGMRVRWQVEIDPYCQRVLAKHWPHVRRYSDIRAVDWGTVEPVDLLCGGFPCQDLSFAGKRAGIDGERSGLWSEYVRAIRALRPRYILVENVPGLLTNEYMGRVLGDLAESGYDAEWDCIPAAKFGAPHRRERIWIIAYPSSERAGGICWGANPDQRDLGEYLTVESCADWGIDETSWKKKWIKGGCPPLLCRVDDGIPNAVDRLHGLGNAIVPQIAEWIGRQIMKVNL